MARLVAPPSKRRRVAALQSLLPRGLPLACRRFPHPMNPPQLTVVDTNTIPWAERFNERIGRALYRKDLYTDPETGAEIRLVRYPKGVINPSHTHPCGHGMYVLEGKLVTHAGTFGPGQF